MILDLLQPADTAPRETPFLGLIDEGDRTFWAVVLWDTSLGERCEWPLIFCEGCYEYPYKSFLKGWLPLPEVQECKNWIAKNALSVEETA